MMESWHVPPLLPVMAATGERGYDTTIDGSFRSISFRVRPSMTPLMTTFSRPEISGWKPAPSSMRAETLPSTRREPEVGLKRPATSLRSVDFPEPFAPMTPKVSPRLTPKETPESAATVSAGSSALPSPFPRKADLSVPNARVRPQRR